jgi:small GTP-binding protein
MYVAKTIANTFKVVIVGSSGVGKSAIVQRLVDGTFREETRRTVGVDPFKPFMIPVDDQTVELQIWDTGGQERFKCVSKMFFWDAVGGVLVFDIASDGSFDDLDEWLHDLQVVNPNAHIILVGNKSDLEAQRRVGAQQARDFAEKHKLEYIETSALNGANVTEAFTRLAFAVAKKVASGQIQNQGAVAKGSPFKSDERKQTEPTGEQRAPPSCC